VQGRPGRSLPDDLRDRVERLHGADLVVDEHDRHERHTLVELGRQRFEIDDAALVQPERAATGRRDDVEHRVVVAGAAERGPTPCAEHAAHGEVVRLRPPAREDDLARTAAHDGGETAARIVEPRPRPPGERVRPGGVARLLGEHLDHGRQRGRAHRAARRMVQVVPLHPASLAGRSF
jgi:hypothetical protein